MRILITGITGFVGPYLAEYCLAKKKAKVYGAMLRGEKFKGAKHIKDKIGFFECNLTDQNAVLNLLKRVKPDKIFHLAAFSAVAASWKSPEQILYNNILAELNIFEAVRKLKLSPVIHIAGCYSEDTKAFTKEGLKSYKDLKIGDEVLSINPKTEEIEYKKIKKVITQKYLGEMINFKSKSCDLLVTPNHKMLVKKAKNKEINFVEAQDLKGRNILPLGRTRANRKSYFSKEIYYLIGIYIGDGYMVPAQKLLAWSGLIHKEYIKQNRDKNGKFVEIEKKQEKTYSSPRAFLAIPKGDKARDKVENILKKLRIKYSTYEKVLYFVPSPRLLDIFLQCGKYAKNKKIPELLLDSDIKSLEELFKGLIDSDGYYRNNRFGYSTISRELTENIIKLARKLGKWVTFREIPSRTSYINQRKVKSSPSYEIYITEGEKILTKTTYTNKKIVDYSGFIWCVEVEDHHNLLVERNGKLTFCGNSCEEYGLVSKKDLPIKESTPFHPLSPYAVSKIAQEMLAYQYHKSYGLKTVVTRTFNHTGPRRDKQFVISSFAYQIAAIERGFQKPMIRTGNLNAWRDFSDVRDIVEAYWLAAEKCKFGEPYNIGSGQARQIKEVLNTLLSFSRVKIKVKQIPELMRPSDVPILQCDAAKFRKATGWKPKISFRTTLKDILNYWRKESI